MKDVPVLLIVFNRPDTTARVLESIRLVKPSRLYVAADGPRADRTGERDRCDETRSVATNVDWDCRVQTLFRSTNLGCRDAVRSAIDWFFASEPCGIILEDDCVPQPSFFAYCSELLQRYEHEERVMHINGSSPVSIDRRVRSSYTFSRYPHVWGWASWRRAWEKYERASDSWLAAKQDRFLASLLGRRSLSNHWTRMFDRVYVDGLDTWDFQWSFACFRHDALCIAPKANLVENIGFRADATHTNRREHRHLATDVVAMEFPLIHPPALRRDGHRDFRLEERKIIVRAGLKFAGPLVASLRGLAAAAARKRTVR